MSFDKVYEFEKLIASFFGSKYAVATDSCTHAIELCLRYKKIKKKIYFPKNTYIGIPLLGYKLNLKWGWSDLKWEDYYHIKNTNIIDAAVLWKKNSYVKNSYMCLSFQHQKHINIGRGGMILLDSKTAYDHLIRMSYDGRSRKSPWRSQNIKICGYHYYMTPENALLGIKKFKQKFDKKPKLWNFEDYPDLSKMKVFSQ